MRSKEVSEAIKMLGNIKLKVIYDLTGNEKRCFDKVLNYIEKLEKMIPTPSNEVPVEYQTSVYVDKRDYVSKQVIRDKIKELEEELKKFDNNFGNCVRNQEYITELEIKIETLKSIIGE